MIYKHYSYMLNGLIKDALISVESFADENNDISSFIESDATEITEYSDVEINPVNERDVIPEEFYS